MPVCRACSRPHLSQPQLLGRAPPAPSFSAGPRRSPAFRRRPALRTPHGRHVRVAVATV